MRQALRVVLCCAGVWLLACGASESTEEESLHEPVAIGSQEGAVCGMLIREQSAPRAQVVHRDGSRFFLCSMGDLLAHRSAPSPHGRVEETFVEVMSPDEDPARSHTGPHPWVLAHEAFYVIGVEREGIMGEPVLTYAERSAAEAVARRYPKARVVDLAGLEAWWRALQE